MIRTYFGRPNSSIRFKAAAAMAWDCAPGPTQLTANDRWHEM
jgi:hypothetical protein